MDYLNRVMAPPITPDDEDEEDLEEGEEEMSSSYKGLQGQIQYVTDNIAIKEKLGKDTTFEVGLIKEWERYLPGGDKHHLWVQGT